MSIRCDREYVSVVHFLLEVYRDIRYFEEVQKFVISLEENYKKSVQITLALLYVQYLFYTNIKLNVKTMCSYNIF